MARSSPNVMTHWHLPATIPGWNEVIGFTPRAGKGPKFDFNEHPEGNMAVAEKYMKKAGYPTRQIHRQRNGHDRRRQGPPAEQDAEIVNRRSRAWASTRSSRSSKRRPCTRSTATSRKKKSTSARASGWIADFADPQTVLNITFNGKLIVPTGNVNWSQANDPELNKAMTEAESVNGKGARAKAWGEDRHETRRKSHRGSVRLGQAGQPRGQARSTASASCGTSASWDYSWTSLK